MATRPNPVVQQTARSSIGRLVTYWVATAVAALAFAIPGTLNVLGAPHITRDLAHLGYPPYFPAMLGTWKILGAIAILLPGRPRLKEWAYAGMIFDLTGAATSRAVMGDGVVMIVVPLVIAAVVGVSWALRPGGRRLEPSPSLASAGFIRHDLAHSGTGERA